MKHNFVRRIAGTMGVAVLIALMSIHADAQLQTFSFFWTTAADMADTVQIDYGSGTEIAGRYHGSLGSTAIYMFCTDQSHTISVPGGYKTLALLGSLTDPAVTPAVEADPAAASKYYYATDLTPLNTTDFNFQGAGLASAVRAGDYNPTGLSTDLSKAQRVSATAYLTEKYLTASMTKAQYAGVQMAIWKIVQDGVNDNTNIMGNLLTGGGRNSTGNRNAAWLFMKTALNDAFANGLSYAGAASQWIQAPSTTLDSDGTRGAHAQDFATYSGDPIPEPAFYQLAALLGLGGLGLMRRRRSH